MDVWEKGRENGAMQQCTPLNEVYFLQTRCLKVESIIKKRSINDGDQIWARYICIICLIFVVYMCICVCWLTFSWIVWLTRVSFTWETTEDMHPDMQWRTNVCHSDVSVSVWTEGKWIWHDGFVFMIVYLPELFLTIRAIPRDDFDFCWSNKEIKSGAACLSWLLFPVGIRTIPWMELTPFAMLQGVPRSLIISFTLIESALLQLT